MAFAAVDQQLAIIRRGIEKIVPEEELAGKLRNSRETSTPLRVKYGIDPSGFDVHLGHTVPLRKIRQFQDLGHQAVIIIGNFTALVGDPSGRDEARRNRLTARQVEENARDYLRQVGKVVDLERAEVHRNGDWFGKMDFADVLELCGRVTVAQLLTRDDFARRYRDKTPIFLHECLYPVMQAHDSVEIRADIELGGTEQLYSFMLARDLQKEAGIEQQIGIMSPILVGLDGNMRMGKSLGNYIGISEPPYEMIKKFMRLPDDCMQMYFELLTNIPTERINSLLAGHLREAKFTLARCVIGEYHGEEAAGTAVDRWQREVSEQQLPTDIPVIQVSSADLVDGGLGAAALLKLVGLCASTSDARRRIREGGAYVGEDRSRISAHDDVIRIETGMMLWIGRKKFCRVELVDS